MPVDEILLERTRRSLSALAISCENRREQALGIIDKLDKIMTTESGKIPIDDDTGEVMEDSRRDMIYDACIPVAEKLLNPPKPKRADSLTDPI